MRPFILIVVLAAAAVAGAGKTQDAGSPRDMAGPASARVSRQLSDAWHYNKLQRVVLEGQRDRILAELARLKTEETEVATKLKSDCQVDVVAGDVWDERTLEIHRRTP